jgi:hypothetical protein
MGPCLVKWGYLVRLDSFLADRIGRGWVNEKKLTTFFFMRKNIPLNQSKTYFDENISRSTLPI